MPHSLSKKNTSRIQLYYESMIHQKYFSYHIYKEHRVMLLCDITAGLLYLYLHYNRLYYNPRIQAIHWLFYMHLPNFGSVSGNHMNLKTSLVHLKHHWNWGVRTKYRHLLSAEWQTKILFRSHNFPARSCKQNHPPNHNRNSLLHSKK